MTKGNPPDYIVQLAVGALQAFCRKYDVKLSDMTIISFAIGWYSGKSFEWTPCAQSFRRITTVDPTAHTSKVALVYGYEGINAALTDELNGLIQQFTSHRWVC